MDIEKYSSGPCPIGRGLALVGDAWSMLILRDAGLGLTRFEPGSAAASASPPNILARRLKALTEAGLLGRSVATASGRRAEVRTSLRRGGTS